MTPEDVMHCLSKYALAGVLLAALAACSSGSTSSDLNAVHSSGLATPASAAAPEQAQPAKSPRGNTPKTVGEVGGLCADKDCQSFAVTFTVDEIEVDPKCTDKYAQEYGQKPENGHFVALSATVKTTDKFIGDVASWSLNPNYFSIVGPDGVTESALATVGTYGCMDQSELLPSSAYSPSSQYVGKVVLDTKNTTGIIVFRPAIMEGGWEWPF